MGRSAPLLALLCAAAIAGCAPAPQRTAEPPPGQAGSQVLSPDAGEDLWETIAEAVPVQQPSQTEYFTAQRAPACPIINVENAEGERQALAPGLEGYVTIVVFWSVDTSSGRAAVRHVDDLVRTYRQWRVRGLTIAEKTQPPAVVTSFLGEQQIMLPVYYDDLSAVETMSEEADAEQETAVPCLFIVDRHMRIRFYRAGFRYMVGGSGARRTGAEMVEESAPARESVQDYLKRVLDEG